jgi:hypothetical protein
MDHDVVATTLVIQIMPLLMREFHVKLDPQLMLSDAAYANTVFELAGSASNERLRGYAQQLRDRLGTLTAGPAGALRSAPVDFIVDVPAVSNIAPAPQAPAAPAPAPSEGAPTRYIRSLR